MDNNQRYVSLTLTNGQFTMPTQPAILPPGWYRMWAVDSMGRVSTAHWIHLSHANQATSSGANLCCCCCCGANPH
jgi:hypothetical protein